MNVVSEILRINETELASGLTHTPASWHTKYSSSAWVYIGNLPHALTEGDILCVSSQYGEIDDVNLVRDADTGKSRGFAFVKYEDARSCVLAVDNLTGAEVLDRTLRVDHVENYRLPKHLREKEEEKLKLGGAVDGAGGDGNGDEGDGDGDGEEAMRSGAKAGHAYEGQDLASSYDIRSGQDLFAPPPPTQDHHDDHDGGNKYDIIDGDENDEGGTESKREAKQARKEARERKRREKEEHRRRKEDHRHRKESKKRSGRRDKDRDERGNDDNDDGHGGNGSNKGGPSTRDRNDGDHHGDGRRKHHRRSDSKEDHDGGRYRDEKRSRRHRHDDSCSRSRSR